MLWHLPPMRATAAAFLRFILSARNGLYFEGGVGAVWLHLRSACTAKAWLCGAAAVHSPALEVAPAAEYLAAPAWPHAGYGPVDQGAFNQYYEKDIRDKPMSKVHCAVGGRVRAGRRARGRAGRRCPPSSLPPHRPVLCRWHQLTRAPPIWQEFNFKMYHSFDPSARIVHLHGWVGGQPGACHASTPPCRPQ